MLAPVKDVLDAAFAKDGLMCRATPPLAALTCGSQRIASESNRRAIRCVRSRCAPPASRPREVFLVSSVTPGRDVTACPHPPPLIYIASDLAHVHTSTLQSQMTTNNAAKHQKSNHKMPHHQMQRENCPHPSEPPTNGARAPRNCPSQVPKKASPGPAREPPQENPKLMFSY